MSRSRSSSSSSNSKSKRNKKSQQNNKQRRRSRSQQSNHKGYPKNQQNTCLYIGNLDKKCTEEQLKKICSEYGQFQYCYIVFEPSSHNDRNKDTKISRGYGFVKYLKSQDSLKAKQSLDKKQILSRKINVEVSNRARPRESTPGRYLGRRRSPPRRQINRYRRRSFSRSSSSERHRRRRHEKERKHKDRERDRQHKRRQRSRSGQKKHRRRDSRSRSPRK